MEFEDLETDISYLAGGAGSYFDSTPWVKTENRFEIRMAENLKVGSLMPSVSLETLERVVAGSVVRQGNALTIHITASGDAKGHLRCEVVAAHEHYLCPRQADSAANFRLAVETLSAERNDLFLTLLPEGRFWVHSEHALPAGVLDWAEQWLSAKKE